MSYRRLGSWSALAAVLLAACWRTHANGEPFPDDPEFMRYRVSRVLGEALETSILTYVDEQGRKVELVSAVHVGDRAYYEGLNERFESYDAVLYELVAEEGARPAPGGAPSGMLSAFQFALTDVLGLVFQLEGVDYSPANFVHADVSPAELDALFAEREDSFLASLLRAALTMAQSEQAPKLNPFALIGALFAEDRATELKRVLGQGLEDVEKLVAGFEDDSGTSVLVTERNTRALKVLDEQLEAGRERIAIFYGAAHMDDFHVRLLERGFEGHSAEWRVAWAIVPAADSPR